MNALQQWKRCPEFIDVDDKNGSVRLTKRDDLYAMRDEPGQNRGDAVEMQLPGDDISILRGAPPADSNADRALLPVYAGARNSTPAVVTGRIFFRLRDDLALESVREAIEALGFVIAEIPAFAPHSAWLSPRSGSVADALSKLASLRTLPGAAHAEPQLLRAKSWKSPP
jgi:hypothetical protein